MRGQHQEYQFKGKKLDLRFHLVFIDFGKQRISTSFKEKDQIPVEKGRREEKVHCLGTGDCSALEEELRL